MKNNLTEKDIENLNKWAEKYDIEELKIKDKEKIFNLEELHITSHNLTELPKEIGILTNLKILDIKCYNLKELPKEIGILTNLKMLDIKCNNLKELPKEIYNLINLKAIYIMSDNLESFPDGIERLTNLEILAIFGKPCNLKILPIEEIKKLNNIKELEIRLKE